MTESSELDTQVEATGETVGEAKWSALRELERRFPGVDKANVQFAVVSEGERGLLGVGHVPARVIASLTAVPAPDGEEEPGSPAARLRELGHLIVIPLLLLPLLPLALLAAPFYALVLRRHERRDAAPHVRPDEELVHELAALEDHVVQNPFTALGHVKPARFRRLSLIVILFLLDYATRHLFNRGNLAGVKTIHFARWVFIDDRRRVFFASNYDGSLESYMDDFIDKVAWGLNLVFSNGVGYPKTRWLVCGGARDELAFKDYLRLHQVPTRVWYSAYDSLTALNIAQNERIRSSLHGDSSRDEERAWVQSL